MSGFAPLVGAKQTLDGLRLWDEDRFDVLCAPDNPHMAGMPPRLTSRDELFKKAVVDNRGLKKPRLVRGQSFAAADCRDRHQQHLWLVQSIAIQSDKEGCRSSQQVSAVFLR